MKEMGYSLAMVKLIYIAENFHLQGFWSKFTIIHEHLPLQMGKQNY